MDSRPNIIVLIADDHRFDALGAAGHSTVRTPSLDRLAARGTHFTRAHCQGGMTGAICAPSRACLMTGSDLFDATASTDLDGGAQLHALHPEHATLPATLRSAGYHTHAVGKWHNDKASFAAGFGSGDALFFGGMSDHWAVPVHEFDPSGTYAPEAATYPSTHSSEMFADATIDFLRGYDGAAPFFSYTAFTAPHDPRSAPAPFDRMYDPDDIELPPNFAPAPAFDTGNGHERDELLLPKPMSRQAVRRELADYYGIISHLDAQIGRILDALDETGQADNTVIIYVADHGLAVGQHGLLGKQNMFDHSVRIPLLVAGPGIAAGAVDDRLCTLADVFPTLCGLADVPVPDSVGGYDLGADEGSHASGRAVVCGAYRDVQRMCSDGQTKLIRFSRSRTGTGTDHELLFDLRNDPWETTDLSRDAAYASDLARLRASLGAWQRAASDPLAVGSTESDRP